MFAYTGVYGKLGDACSGYLTNQPAGCALVLAMTLSNNWNTELPRVPVIMLVLEFHVHGCQSLKEKRGRLQGLRQRFGKGTGVAVCESDFQDQHSQAQWSFVATAADTTVVKRALQEIEEYAAQFVDAELTSARSFELN